MSVSSRSSLILNSNETENGENVDETDPVSNLDRGTLIHTDKNIIESRANKSIAKNISFFALFWQF